MEKRQKKEKMNYQNDTYEKNRLHQNNARMINCFANTFHKAGKLIHTFIPGGERSRRSTQFFALMFRVTEIF